MILFESLTISIESIISLISVTHVFYYSRLFYLLSYHSIDSHSIATNLLSMLDHSLLSATLQFISLTAQIPSIITHLLSIFDEYYLNVDVVDDVAE
jgi:hypothetical protein